MVLTEPSESSIASSSSSAFERHAISASGSGGQSDLVLLGRGCRMAGSGVC